MSHKLFVFSIPDLEMHRFAVPAIQIKATLTQHDVQDMPSLPEKFIGLQIWNGTLVPIVNLAMYIGETDDSHSSNATGLPIIIAQVSFEAPIEYIGWPILANPNIVELPKSWDEKPLPLDLTGSIAKLRILGKDFQVILLNLFDLA